MGFLAKNKVKVYNIYMKKNTGIIIAVIIVFVVMMAAIILVFSLGERREIDCMPPIPESDQKCLDEGKCFCATY